MDDIASDLLSPRRSAPPQKAQRQEPDSGSVFNPRAASDTLRMVPEYAAGGVLGIQKGLADYAVGAAQNLANLPFMPDAAAEGMSKYMAAREQAYGNAAPNAQDSVSIGRVTGNILPTLAAGQSQPAPTLLGRMGQSGKIGALSSFLMPVEGDPKDHWTTKAIQTGLSGGIAFLAPALIEPTFRAVSAAVNGLASKFRGAKAVLTGQASDSAVENRIKVELQREGVNWNDIAKDVRSSLVSEAKKALKAGVDLDPKAISRIAKAQEFDVNLTQGQATRNPLAWSREQNIARTGAGQDIAERYTDQNTKLIGELDNQVTSRAASGADPYDVGTGVIRSLKEADDALTKPIDAAYASARDNLGRASPMDAATFSQNANRALDEKMLGSYLPPEVRTILNDVSIGKIPFNVNTAVQIDRVLSAAQAQAGKGTPQALAIGQIRDALNKAPIADNAGVSAKAAFDSARKMAAERFGLLERTPGMAAAVEPGARLAPEKFVEKYVISKGASIDDVTALLKQLNPDAKMQLQAQVMSYLRNQATSNANSEVAKFSQSAFKKALDRVGDKKLNVIFGENVAKRLRNLQEVSALIQADPVAAGVNRSWTTPAGLDFMDRVAKMPVLGTVMGNPGDLYRGYLAGQALNFPLGTPQSLGAGVLPESLLARLQPRVGLLGAPVAAGLSTGFVQQ